MKRVAVIGAGAAGLVALRHLVSRPSLYQCVAYEASDRVGGTWKYSEIIDETDRSNPSHGAMYQNLQTNLPKEIMSFPGLDFDQKLPSFIGHTDVQKYLEDYAQHFQLLRHIKFNTRVQKVSRGPDNQWIVETCNSRDRRLENPSSTVTSFDAIFVCNGHYSVPLVPDIEGMSEFQGTIEHSRDYRKPDKYTGKNVVLLGARPSGQDISVDVSKVAKRVILSHRSKVLETPLPDNVHQRLGIVRYTKNGVVFQDGCREEDVDHVILCTGYLYSFPFLDESCGLTLNEGRITPLYKHIVNVSNPTMFFIGICATICPFRHFDVQVRYTLSWLENKFIKPDDAAMLEWIENDYNHKTKTLGWKHKYAHTLGDLQWQYADDLAKEGRIESITPVIQKIYDHVFVYRRNNVLTYRNVEFRLENDEDYSYFEPVGVES